MKICDCGAEIEFGISPKGARIPLIPVGHIYQLIGDRAVPVKGLFRNHFLDCPKASEHRTRPARGAASSGPGDGVALTLDLLELFLKNAPNEEEIRAWSPEAREEARSWAARMHEWIAGGPGPAPEKPGFLARYL